LLIILSAGGVCVHEIPTWNTIAKEATISNCTVRGLSLNSLEGYKKNLSLHRHSCRS